MDEAGKADRLALRIAEQLHAMTEPETGSDAFAMRTQAVPDADGYRISGVKTFISNATMAPNE